MKRLAKQSNAQLATVLSNPKSADVKKPAKPTAEKQVTVKKMLLKDLKVECKRLHLKQSGTKSELEARLQEAQAQVQAQAVATPGLQPSSKLASTIEQGFFHEKEAIKLQMAEERPELLTDPENQSLQELAPETVDRAIAEVFGMVKLQWAADGKSPACEAIMVGIEWQDFQDDADRYEWLNLNDAFNEESSVVQMIKSRWREYLEETNTEGRPIHVKWTHSSTDSWVPGIVTVWANEQMQVDYSQDANERVQRIDLIHPSMVDLAILQGRTPRHCGGWIWTSHKAHEFNAMQYGDGTGYTIVPFCDEDQEEEAADVECSEQDFVGCCEYLYGRGKRERARRP